MAEHDPFGQPGGAARIGQRDQIALEVERHLGRTRGGIAVGDRIPRRGSRRGGVADDQDVLHPGDAAADGLDDRQPILVHDEHARLGIVELILDFLLVVGRVDRRQHAAHLRSSFETDQVFGPVGHEQRDAVALGDAQIAQAVGQRVAEPFDLAEGELLVVEDGRPLVRMAIRRAAQELVIRNARVVELGSDQLAAKCAHLNLLRRTAENFVAGWRCQGAPSGRARAISPFVPVRTMVPLGGTMVTVVVLAAGRGTRMGALTAVDAEAAAVSRRPAPDRAGAGRLRRGWRAARRRGDRLPRRAIEAALGRRRAARAAHRLLPAGTRRRYRARAVAGGGATGCRAVRAQLGRHPGGARVLRRIPRRVRAPAMRRPARGQPGGRSVARRRRVRRRRLARPAHRREAAARHGDDRLEQRRRAGLRRHSPSTTRAAWRRRRAANTSCRRRLRRWCATDAPSAPCRCAGRGPTSARRKISPPRRRRFAAPPEDPP